MPLCRLGLWLGNFTSVRGAGVSIRLAVDSCLGRWRCFSGVLSAEQSTWSCFCGCSTEARAALSAGKVVLGSRLPCWALMESSRSPALPAAG